MTGEQGIRVLPASRQVCDPAKGPGMTLDKTERGNLIRRGRRVIHRSLPPGEHAGDRVPGDPLHRQLLTQGPLAARMRPVTRFNPRSGEPLVIEKRQIEETSDDPVHERGLVPSDQQPPSNLGDGALPRLEESQGRLEDNRRVIDLRVPCAAIREGPPVRPPGRVTRPPRCLRPGSRPRPPCRESWTRSLRRSHRWP